MNVRRPVMALVATTLLGTVFIPSSMASTGSATPAPAVLAGHAVLPAGTSVLPPEDAPENLRTAGKYTASSGRRADQLGSVTQATGFHLPMENHPVQGFSGIKRAGDGTYYVLQDNGFGNKANSHDAMLMFHRIRPDWETGEVERLETAFLHDPDRLLPFPVVNEATSKRYLTGADLDIESIQPTAKGEVYLADEFGPYLIRVDATGRVNGFWETQVPGTNGGQTLKSPDHYTVQTPGAPGAVSFAVRRSKGYEGMAISPDGQYLYLLLEGALWDAEAKDLEKREGREYLRIFEFSTAEERFTGRTWKYLLELNGNAIGDFNMMDADTGMIIERDNGQGDANKACKPGDEGKADCFPSPAKFKRIYKVGLDETDSEGFVRKVAYVDLLNIADPEGKARAGGKNGLFTFPFTTIEDVDIVDAEHIIVANDNNFPFSIGRQPGRADNNELILLKVPAFINAR